MLASGNQRVKGILFAFMTLSIGDEIWEQACNNDIAECGVTDIPRGWAS